MSPRVGDPDGHGHYAQLERDDEGRPLCHECGTWWQHLATHARGAHGIPAAAYRQAHGLGATTRLVGDGPRERMRAAYAARGDEPLARLAATRDPDAARAASPATWAPQTRAARATTARARRGRPLTPEETERLADVEHDLQAWVDRARTLLAQPDISARSIAEAADIATPTVHQRLRRYPARD
ncbi:winged helix-turn-helix domain-containing protein [Oerskovia turbata]